MNSNKIKIIKNSDIDQVYPILEELMDFRAHRAYCEIYYTDFCTCGLKQISDKAKAILKQHQTND